MKIVMGGGKPIFRYLPRVVRWGPCLSIFWLGKELVFISEKK